MKAINVSKNISVPRFSFNRLWLVIAAVLRRFTTAENDYAIRFEMCELTADEARAEILGDIANHEKNMREAYAWSDIWHEGGVS